MGNWFQLILFSLPKSWAQKIINKITAYMRNYMVYTMCYWDYNDLFHKNNNLKLAFLVSANFSQFWPFLTNFGQLKFIFAGYLLPLWCLLWPAQCAPPLQPRSRLPSCYQDGRLRLRSEHERKRKVCRFAVFFLINSTHLLHM